MGISQSIVQATGLPVPDFDYPGKVSEYLDKPDWNPGEKASRLRFPISAYEKQNAGFNYGTLPTSYY